jgi:hypothetical protein
LNPSNKFSLDSTFRSSIIWLNKYSFLRSQIDLRNSIMPAPDWPSAAVNIFYSYSHKDASLRGELEKHLSILTQSNVIRAWHDRDIAAGDEWDNKISEHLESAHIILLLISADFLASQYCHGVEMNRAMERHEQGEALIIPIILRPVDWRGAVFSKLQALPTDAKPATSWSNIDEAFVDIAKGIRSAVEGLTSSQQPSNKLLHMSPAWNLRPDVPELLPYLCDRSDQERELCIALREHQELNPRRPFLCIIHGNQRECHSEFLLRMQQTSMAGVLNLKQRLLSVEEYRLQWPASSKASPAVEPVFLSNLGEALLENAAATKDELLEFMSAHEKPLLITSRLLTEDFALEGMRTLSAFMRFWNDWPDLPPGRVLISCVCLKYQSVDKLFLTRRWRMKKKNEQLRRLISELNFREFEGLRGVALSELQAIRQGDVLAWIHSKPVRDFCKIREKEISLLFGRAELCTNEGHISMEMLADELRVLLRRSRH